MITQSLYERYLKLSQDPASGMAPPGFSTDKISLCWSLLQTADRCVFWISVIIVAKAFVHFDGCTGAWSTFKRGEALLFIG